MSTSALTEEDLFDEFEDNSPPDPAPTPTSPPVSPNPTAALPASVSAPAAPLSMTLIGQDKEIVSTLFGHFSETLRGMGDPPDGRKIEMNTGWSVDYMTAKKAAAFVVVVLSEEYEHDFHEYLADIRHAINAPGHACDHDVVPGACCIVVMYKDSQKCFNDESSPAVLRALGSPPGGARGAIPVFSMFITSRDCRGDADDCFPYFLNHTLPTTCSD